MPEGRQDRRTLRGRLLLMVLLVLAPVLAGCGIWLMLLSQSADDYEQLVVEAEEESAEIIDLQQDLRVAERAGNLYIDTGRRVDRRAFRLADARVRERLTDADAYDEPAEANGLAAIRQPWIAAADQVYQREGTRRERHDRFTLGAQFAAGGIERLLASFQAEIEDDLSETDAAARLNWLLGVAAIAAALGLAALLATRFSRALLRPLEGLAAAARSLGAGHLDHRVELGSTAELDEVGSTFNAMAAALQEQREELERHAFVDGLTGLANRALFEDRARHALDRVADSGERVAVLVLDIDGFKLVNDGLGHACGDGLLRQVGERIAAALRPSDTLARLGSDEYAILLEHVRGPDDALGAAERVRQAFLAPFALKGSDVVITVSVGIALSGDAAQDEVELLRRADRAMYRVKQNGRNGSEFFDPDMDDQAGERLQTLNDLRGAVDRGEIVVHYQPIVDLDTGNVCAAEALARWRRPGHGLVPPLDFIPLAEQAGVIVPLGAYVLREACAEAQRWSEDGHGGIRVTVNVSSRQLLDPSFEATVAAALAETGLDPARLILEVTESSLMHQPEVTIPKLDRLSESGVRMALDDFGEGYSSLAHLRDLPIDILKIARPFVHELTANSNDPALVRGIIELARSLGLRLIAEGIESPEQQAILRALSCQLGQGFLFSPPVERGQLRTLLAEQHARL
jgi:diguanylate cyclase (GGDEF)-like protein